MELTSTSILPSDWTGKTLEEFVIWLFDSRCVTCRKPATEINHIIPRSRGQVHKDNWKNMITQCSKCHQEHHHNGVTGAKIEYLQETRRMVLMGLGRGKFV